jgi:hypothetical protein
MRAQAAELAQFPLQAESYGCVPQKLEARAQHFGRAARMRRAGRLAGLLFLGALLSAPIPLLHLVSVPGFLAAAVWLGVKRLRQHSAIEAVSGPCPACGQPQQYAVPPEASFPLVTTCPGCRDFINGRDVR